MLDILVRPVSNSALQEGMPAFAVQKRMIFNGVNLFILVVSVFGLLQALFSGDHFFRRNVLLVSLLIFCTGLALVFFVHKGRFRNSVNISFLLYPPLFVLLSITTGKIIIQLNIILLCVLAFFLLNKKRNIIIYCSYFLLCLVAGSFWYLRHAGTDYLPPLLIIIAVFLVFYSALDFLRIHFLKYRQQVKNNVRMLTLQKSLVETQKKELEQKAGMLEAKLKSLSELNRAKTVMFSVLSHDLKDSIYCLHRSLEIAEDDENGYGYLKAAMPLLKENSGHTIQLLENLLQWGKTLLQSAQPVCTEVDINHLLRAVISFESRIAAHKKINIVIEAEKKLFAYADRNMMEIVFRNILANAIKFSNPGYPVSVFAEKKNGAIHISVIDYGIGMNETEVNMLLNGKMYAAPGTYNEKGTGIGLLLCKELLEKNTGTLAIDSKKGMGTKVEITLPVHHSSGK